jgi:hypothetical protein
MDRIFADHDDVRTHGVYVYIDNRLLDADGNYVAYADKECTVKLTFTELKEAFLKGMVVCPMGVDEYLKPLVGRHVVENDEHWYEVTCGEVTNKLLTLTVTSRPAV